LKARKPLKNHMLAAFLVLMAASCGSEKGGGGACEAYCEKQAACADEEYRDEAYKDCVAGCSKATNVPPAFLSCITENFSCDDPTAGRSCVDLIPVTEACKTACDKEIACGLWEEEDKADCRASCSLMPDDVQNCLAAQDSTCSTFLSCRGYDTQE
jgi:hypothetical protein